MIDNETKIAKIFNEYFVNIVKNLRIQKRKVQLLQKII